MYRTVEAVCACGNKFETRTTAASIHVEVCNACHPYFTGKQRLMDTAGRVDRFRRKYGSAPAAPPAAEYTVVARLPRALAQAERDSAALSHPAVGRDADRLTARGR